MNRSLFASACLAALPVLLAACEPFDDVAHAGSADMAQASTATVYVGDEYVAAQRDLPPNLAPAAPTF